ncbi:MAG: UDP-N-acetylmuramate dehydrogenase [Proteobacteria bacterium]|nr:UDP-N-acetylmuramate dehydrogenase [Pseudomonadota bacterium]
MDIFQMGNALAQNTGLRIEHDVSLKKYTSLHIGGPAALFATVHTLPQAQALLSAAHELSLPVLLLGGGTNLLISDDGYEGLAVSFRFADCTIADDGLSVTVGASVPAAALVDHLVHAGRQGLEFAAGLPGTVGGAIAGNAGCFGSSFGEHLQRATVLDAQGNLLEITDPAWFRFAYRHSRLSEELALIVDATFQLRDGDTAELRQIAQSHCHTRRTKHPGKHIRTAGSYFKNLPPKNPGEWRRPAGALLDQVGAKQLHVGDAAVFEKHANIFINRQNASAKDVLQLEALLQTRVYDAFGERLEPEVRFVGRRPQHRK